LSAIGAKIERPKAVSTDGVGSGEAMSGMSPSPVGRVLSRSCAVVPLPRNFFFEFWS